MSHMLCCLDFCRQLNPSSFFSKITNNTHLVCLTITSFHIFPFLNLLEKKNARSATQRVIQMPWHIHILCDGESYSLINNKNYDKKRNEVSIVKKIKRIKRIFIILLLLSANIAIVV